MIRSFYKSYTTEYCSVVDLTQAPTYLQKLRTDEVLKSLENELKQNNF